MTVSLPFINKVLYLRVKAVLWAINYGLVPSRLILYVGNGGEVLPPPLSTTEEGKLLMRLEKGDTQVKGELIERNLRLVCISEEVENGNRCEDLISALGLLV